MNKKIDDVKNMTDEELKHLIEKLSASRKNKDRLALSIAKTELSKRTKEKGRSSEELPSPSGAFIPSAGGSRFRFVDIDKIDFPEYQDRTGIEEKELKALAESIREHGVMQPVSLLETQDGHFLKIAGRRRIEASKMIGKKKIPAIVTPADEVGELDQFAMMLKENTLREDLSIYDRVRAALKLIRLHFPDVPDARKFVTRIINIEKGNLPNAPIEEKARAEKTKELVASCGLFKSIYLLGRQMKVLDMPEALRKALDENRISFMVAEVVLKKLPEPMPSGWNEEKIIDHVAKEQMSAKEAEEFLLSITPPKPGKKREEEVLDFFATKTKKKIRKLDEEKRHELAREVQKLLKKYGIEG
jgi:ParB family chromosome partitioning protein